MKTIEFENTGKYITAFNDGKVEIRCDFDYTDCREDEPLPAFINRHGGIESTIEYLHESYREGWCLMDSKLAIHLQEFNNSMKKLVTTINTTTEYINKITESILKTVAKLKLMESKIK